MGKRFTKHKEEMVKVGIDEEITLKEFAFYLKTVRESLKLTHEEMANIIGKSVNSLKKYESGNVEPEDAYVIVQAVRSYIKTNVKRK